MSAKTLVALIYTSFRSSEKLGAARKYIYYVPIKFPVKLKEVKRKCHPKKIRIITVFRKSKAAI